MTITISDIKNYQEFTRLQDLVDQGHFDIDGVRPKLNITITITN